MEHETTPDPDENKYKKETRRLPTWTSLLVLLYLISVFLLVVRMDRRLPTALTTSDIPDNPERFIEERSRRVLRDLTSIGARPAGSYENEVLAVDLLKRELQSIQARCHPKHKLTIDIQVRQIQKPLYLQCGETHSLQQEIMQVISYDILETSGKF